MLNTSGAGTNLKVGAHIRNFLSSPPVVLALKVQLVVLVSAFVMVSTVWPVSCLLFFCSRCPASCKSGSTFPHGVGATANHTNPLITTTLPMVGWDWAPQRISVRPWTLHRSWTGKVRRRRRRHSSLSGRPVGCRRRVDARRCVVDCPSPNDAEGTEKTRHYTTCTHRWMQQWKMRSACSRGWKCNSGKCRSACICILYSC